MLERINDLIQKIEDKEYRLMLELEDRVFYDEDKKAEKALMKMCKKYGLTTEEFITWCEEY